MFWNAISRTTVTFGAAAVLAVVLFTPLSGNNQALADSPKVTKTQFHDAMRKLWEDHITWTRLYIVSFAGGLPDKGPTAARLLENQVAIGDAIVPFYGKEAGTKLTGLLKAHILGAVDILTAAKAGDKTKLDTATKAWYSNADDIATFLSLANPKGWPLTVMKAQMKMHLDLTMAEATNQLSGDYPASITDYDKVNNHILMLADALSSGIVSQFPNKFADSP